MSRVGPVMFSSALARGRRARVGFGLTAAVLAGAVTYVLQGSSPPAPVAQRTVEVALGDVAVTVGGVGRIVPASAASSVATAAASGAAASSGTGSQGGGAAVQPDAVFPRAIGTVSRLLVKPGQRVVAGQRIAVLDDARAAATASQQAQDDLAAARLELARMLNPLSPAEASTLRLDIRRAQAELETLRGGTAADRTRAMRIAKRNVAVARNRLELVLHPRTAADVAAAQAEVGKAAADLAALTTPAPQPSPSALAAAQAAVTAARARLTKLTGPPNPAAVSAARLDVAKADADLTLVRQQVPAATAAEVAAATTALDAAAARLALLLGPPDPADVAAAEADLRKAEAELAALQAPAPRPSAEAVAAAQLVLAAARGKLDSLRQPASAADVATARLELERALSDRQTLRTGPNPGALAAARTAVATGRTRLNTPSNPLDIELAKVRVASAGSRLSAARLTEQLLTVRAAYDGTVTSVLTKRGSPADPATPVAVVSDLGRMAVDVDISEFDAARVQQGMRAVLSVDALGGKAYPGTVRFAAPTGSDNGGVVTFPVRVDLPNADGLKAGMNVSVRIVVDERRKVVLVPLETVSRGGGGQRFVSVLDAGGRASRRPVELGLANNKTVEVVTGLRAGERVVLAKSGGGGGE